MQTGVSSAGTAASLTLSNPLSFAYMQSSEVNRISLTRLPAVAMALVSSGVSGRSLLISRCRAFRASYSARSAPVCGSCCSGEGLWVPARVPENSRGKKNKF